jgi:titin
MNHSWDSGLARARRLLAHTVPVLLVAGTLPLVLVISVLPQEAGAVTTTTSGTTVTDTYSYTGSVETFTVPDNVTSLSVTLTGAEGAEGGDDAAGTAPPGGYRGVVTGTIGVIPGEVLSIGVGKGGTNSPDWSTCTGGADYPTGDPNDAIGGINPLGGYAGGAGGSPGHTGCSGYGGSGGAASVIELGTSGDLTSVATIVAGGSGGSGGSGQFLPTLGQISLPTFIARADETSTSGEDGESVYTACHQVTGEQCDGGGGAGGGGGAQGGANGFVEFGSGTSDEWFGLGAYPGENSTGGLSGLNPQYSYYADDNSNGSVVLSYSSGSPGAPVVVDGMPGDSSVALYWAAPTVTGSSAVANYVVRYATSPFTSWTTATECTGTSTSCVVTGLTNGTGYEFEVAAVNGEGQGVYSAASDVVTPTGPPGAPAITGVTPSDGSLSFAFTPASSSQPILDYEYSLDGGNTWTSTGTIVSPAVISGLTNGTTYSVELRAQNSVGDGAPSTPASGTPSALPGAPTITNITPGGNGTSLGVSFVPGYTGGSTIIGYQYAVSVGAGTFNFGSWTDASGTTSPLTISGLINGTTYSVELRAVNSSGDGPASVYQVGVTLTVPDAPTIASLTPGDATIAVSYAPYDGTSDGGSALSDVEYSLDGGSTWTSAGTLADPFTISGLTNGTPYSVELETVNGVGTSAPSAPSPATPATAPGLPLDVTAVGGPGSVSVTWQPPLSNGGSTITNYTVSAYSAASGGAAIASCTSSTLTCSISGLSTDVTYYVGMNATNAVGPGPFTSPRVTAYTVALPGAPVISTLTEGDAYISAPFTAGSSDTNNPITGYQYSVDGGTTWQNSLGSTSPMTISGLTNGTDYTVELRAMSAAGPGAASNSESATPYAAPDATSNATTTYVAGSGGVTVSWVAPNDNGAAISTYTVTAFSALIGGTQVTFCTTAALSCSLSGLGNGVTYYISIQSVNVHSQYSLRSPLIPVVPGSPSTTLLSASPTTSANFGSPVTLSATVTSGATGTVDFEVGGVSIASCGSVTISSSEAQCVTSALPGGDDSLVAAYSGNSTYASSASSALSFQVDAQNQSALTITTTLTAYAPSPANTATLSVSGGTTAGAVTYQADSTGNTAGCSISGDIVRYTSAGTCSITATMAGNADYNPVSSADTLFVVQQISTTTTLAATPSSSDYGTLVTLTATVTPAATGAVDFEVGGVSIASCGAVTISSGQAECATSALSANADDALSAVYSGDVDDLASTSTTLDYDVSPSTANVLTFTSSAPSASVGESYIPVVSSSAGLTPVITVDASSASACSISNGTVKFLEAGSCVLDANQPGDTDYSAAAQVQQTVTVQANALPRAPSSPVDVSATFGAAGVVVTWSAPLNPGSSAIEGYTVSASPGGATCSTSGATTCSLTGLSSSSSYAISVVARSSVGTSPASSFTLNASSSSTGTSGSGTGAGSGSGSGGTPSAPRGVETSHSGSDLTVSWRRPSTPSGAIITGYRVTISPGGKTCTTTGATTCTVSGLSSTVRYHVSVVALSGTGTSKPASVSTNVASTSNVLGSIGFAFDSSSLSAGDRRMVERVATKILATKIKRVTLEGYTDSVGSVAFNEVLSARRAAVTGKYLRELLTRRGDRTTKINIIGKGIRRNGTTASASRTVIVID